MKSTDDVGLAARTNVGVDGGADYAGADVDAGVGGVPKNNVLLIDGYGLLFRAFYAMPSLVTNAGVPVGGVYGVCRILLSLMRKNSGASFVVCLDGGGGSFRNQIYGEYKSNRVAPSEEMVPQFDLFDELIDVLGLARERRAGFEADDIIAAYTKVVSKGGGGSVIVSSDKDLMQLIAPDVLYYDPKAKAYFNEADVVAKFGVVPSALADYLAFVGDSSDNVPGVKSVGSKTAAKIISDYGSVEGVYDRIEEIKSAKLKDILLAGKDSAFMSKKLVSLADATCDNADLAIPSAYVFNNEDVAYRLGMFGDKYSINALKWGGFGGSGAGAVAVGGGDLAVGAVVASKKGVAGKRGVAVDADVGQGSLF